ncbi:cytochrome bc complex cytochrome b subunit [Paludisphaera sp.]|uniref:cytochrome b n=1 Tax=Paludisphaera sp. TaxID=2017432 RepID=UPI00301C9037
MRKLIAEWFEDRTGLGSRLRAIREEPLPAGPRWRYASGSALLAILLVQAFTGMMMTTAYSAGSSTAWGSVYYIEHQMWMGWLIRGLHHFGSQAVMVLAAVHLLQVLFAAAYRAPREVNWWLGLVLLGLLVGFGHTGYQLPWDQKGYWATKVSTNIAGGAPVIGPYIQTVLVGGVEYGNQTLTRFYGLHVVILPTLLALTLGAHLALRHRHGLKPPEDAPSGPRADGYVATYFPDQTFRNAVVVTGILGVLFGLVLWHGGAPLDAPADPSSADYEARPEWYFRFLYQMLKYFPGHLEWVGSIAVPGGLMTALALLPILDKFVPSKALHVVACGTAFLVVGGATFFTIESFYKDSRSESFIASREKADADGKRAIFLASHPDFGIPPEGSSYLFRYDPLTRGSFLLERKCLSCHSYDGKAEGEQSAPELKDFGSLAWIRGLLEDPAADAYYGKVPECDGMIEWKKTTKLDAKQLDQVAEFVATFARIPEDHTVDDWLNTPGVTEHPGYDLFVEDCGKCHMIDGFTDGGLRDSPDLFAWGSPRWTRRMIRRPSEPSLYGYLEDQQRMPASPRDEMPDRDVDMIIRYLQGDYLPQPAPTH